MQLTSNRVAFAGTHLCTAAWGRVYCTPLFLTLLSSQGGLAVAQIIASSSNFHRMIPELSKRCVLGRGSAATDQ